jgi:hypothetical protein
VGAGNVKLVYARWYDLPDLPFRLLAYMALVSMDGDLAPSYWGGWESLALAAGRLVPERNDAAKDVVKVRRAALKAVNVATGVLLDRRAVRVKTAAAPGRNTTYELMLANRTVHADREPSRGGRGPNGSRLPATTVHGYPADGSRLPGLTVHGEREPEEYEEQVRTQPRNESADLDADVTGPRAPEVAEDPISIPDEVVAPVLRLVTDDRPAVGSRRWSSRGQDAIAEAMARRAAARAAHQQTAGESA